MSSPLSDIYTLSDNIKTKRISSYDRTGKNADCIQIGAGETVVIAQPEGAGIIKHIWITLESADAMIRRNAILRMYWDGEENPSVESPLGDFFGQGFGMNYCYASLPMAAAPEEGRALNCYFPMPFGHGAKITLENQSDAPITRFYFYVDYEVHPSIGDDAGRFHAWWNREITTPAHPDENEWAVFGDVHENRSNAHNYLFADIEGKGKFVGVNYYVENPSPMWYGEGDDMFVVDGEAWPFSLHGTGTEDFFNSSWCPKEVYTHPYFGYPLVNNQTGWLGRTHCYRYMLEEPVYFAKSLHASIEHGHANYLTLDISSVAYWYQTGPHKPFPPMPPKEKRQNMPKINVEDMLRWRGAWRDAKGGGALWGNEK